MTLRARPVARRRGRAGWDSGDRRNNLINLGFFAAIGISVLILVGYAAYSWYDDHFGAAATVNGQVITKDDLRNRLAIENFRLEYIGSRIQTLMAKGRISPTDGQQQLDFLSQRRDQLASLTLERLIDVNLMAGLATTNGVTVTDADIDAQVLDEATTTEQRHTWVIEVQPAVDPKTGEVGAEQKRTALVRAQQAYARLKGGESWADVAKTISDSGLAPQAGELGWLAVDSGYDDPFMTAIFATAPNEITDIITGDDDIYRIGRVTEIAPAEVDTTFQAQIGEAGIKLADYRVAARGDVVRKRLSDKVVADMSSPGKQRHVLEIYLPQPNAAQLGAEPGVKVRQIEFAPNDDTTTAEALDPNDPAWAKAKGDADAAYAEIKARPANFDAIARARSDEPSAKQTGGKQPWYYASSSVDQAFKNAIFTEGLKDGQLLEPVKGAFAWFVIQFMRTSAGGEATYLQTLRDTITSENTFRQAARDYSEGPEAKDGGDLGWIAIAQLDDQLDATILATDIGANSSVVPATSGGTYMFRVLAEETRSPTKEQLAIFKQNGFSYWYTRQKEAAKIDYNIGTNSSTG